MLVMRLLTVVFVLFVGACGRVEVVDQQGAPIQGAQVAPVSPSITGTAVTTNSKGEASVPLFIGQATAWIDVSKAGFTSQQVPVPTKWPLRVVLQPAPPP